MSKFTPDPGALHYTSCKPYKKVVGGNFPFGDVLSEPKVIEQQDRSYEGDVFRCVARDDHAIVCRRLTGHDSGRMHTFVNGRYAFAPGGPSAAAARGVAQEAKP